MPVIDPTLQIIPLFQQFSILRRKQLFDALQLATRITCKTSAPAIAFSFKKSKEI
tara:strand:- start:813 stop:977 length:165 start_codon:yes stop_codon:yes gene_type:complete